MLLWRTKQVGNLLGPMTRQLPHAMLVPAFHDEASRQSFVMDFRRFLGSRVAPANRDIYEAAVRPAHERRHGREPESINEMRRALTANPSYQMYSAMQRRCQEMTWDSVIDSVERELPQLIQKAKSYTGETGGTLKLDPELAIARYLTSHDIHLQPGGYHASYCENDVAAGAIYDRGVYLYSMGQRGPRIEYLGRTVIAYFQERYGKAPRRILDMGCTAGNSTIAYKEAFPVAEVFGLDVGDALLRYAHARAESMALPIHFSQQNAEATNFEDESFDLIVSHLLLHETATSAVSNIFAECQRLLAPGGVMLHQDVPRFDGMSPLNEFLASWEVYNNNEVFAGASRRMDVVTAGINAGFPKDKVKLELVPNISPPSITNYNTNLSYVPVLVGEK